MEDNKKRSDSSGIKNNYPSQEIPLNEYIFTIETRGNGATSIKFEYTKTLNFLHSRGYRAFNNELICIVDNIAKVVSREDIFKFLLNHIEYTFKDDSITNAFYKEGESLIIKKDGLLLGIKEAEREPLRDNASNCFIAYKNGVVKISKSKIEISKYSELECFVWEEQIIDRHFEFISYYDISPNVYDKCLRNSTNNNNHFKSVISAIGYLVHNFKDQRLTRAIIINDENLEEENERGGSGKGLIVKAISKIRPVLIINGKNADPINDRFFLQGVTQRTCVISIDDPKRNMNFESYFSYLTEGMTVEEKHKKSKFIPFKDSPKFSFTTNYTVKGDSSSHRRRRFDIFINGYYSSEHTPDKDFGHEFFEDWDKAEWNKFDFFIAKCAQTFLKKGLVSYDSHELKLKKLRNETSSDFYDLMENHYNQHKVQYSFSEVRAKLVCMYGNKYEFVNKDYKLISRWISMYANYKGFGLETDRKSEGIWFWFEIDKNN
jgi:hypothetical protein